jgi:hypothetical protein
MRDSKLYSPWQNAASLGMEEFIIDMEFALATGATALLSCGTGTAGPLGLRESSPPVTPAVPNG